MRFNYSKENLKGLERILQKFCEILPGFLSWSILLGMIILSVTKPLWGAILIMAFYIYWLYRLFYMTIFLVLSYYRLKTESKTSWIERVKGMDQLDMYIKSLKKEKKKLSLGQILSLAIHKKELRDMKESGNYPPQSDQIYHLVIYPIIKESMEIVEPGLKSLLMQDFPTERMLVILALEERASGEIKEAILKLGERYKSKFLNVLAVIHPDGISGEARVKGANVTFAAKEAAKFLAREKIPYENVIMSCFDADTVVSPHYFSCLTYYFMVMPHREKSSFQPIPVYHNNIWDVPAFARVMETSASFFQLIEATNPGKLVTFSSHSMSFKALVDVGYWPVDMISDDSAIYWKTLIHYDGRYGVVPMYVTVSMDIVGSDKFFETAKSIYKQKRRWAWGVENFPIVMRAFFRPSRIPITKRIGLGFKLLEGHISWATWGFILSVIGWLPALFARQEFASSVAYYNIPRINAAIFQLAFSSLVILIIISINLLPKKKTKGALFKKITHAFEWLLIPITLSVFGAAPALDAQTRLMFGQRMKFWVADKKRKK